MRDEEESDDCWFMLPEADDEETNWLDFKVGILGPETYSKNPVPDAQGERPSPYAGGMFRVRMKFPDSYPATAPEVFFATKTWHPNVDWTSGKVCMDDVLGGNVWKPTMGVRGVLAELRSMLGERSDGGVNADARKELAEDVASFDKHAREVTLKYATD
jgi:ubiquitin-protein ligase